MSLPSIVLGPLSSYLSSDRYLLTLESLSSSTSQSRQIVLFRLARQGLDKFYAIESECPHAGGPMLESEVQYGGAASDDIEDLDTVVAVCPWHAYDFDLRTGESSTGFKACTWSVHVLDNMQRSVIMEGPENSGEWRVVLIEGVSEAFVEPTLPPSIPLSAPTTLTDWACLILQTPEPDQKVALTREALRLLRSGSFRYPDGIIGQTAPPDKPPRLPPRNDVKPAKMGKSGSNKSQLTYLHNITHIEQWAIDLAWDLISRFARPFRGIVSKASEQEKSKDECMPLSFFEDWATIAEEEAKHFTLLRARLESKGSFYGQFKTQDGLWDAAHTTRDDIKVRLSIVCLVHEARGLDVNPGQIIKFRAIGDLETVAAMTVVHADEISHVAAGHRYLEYVCEKEGLDAILVFRENVKRHFAGRLKGPFNREDRSKAGMEEEWYAGDW